MSVFKCKMCGAGIEVTGSETVCTCEYCNAVQTIPGADDGKKLNLFNRANKHRSVCDFDRAQQVFESIVAEYPEEPEAYWGLVLCKYGIEYVDDPLTEKKIPTCHRTSYISIFEDADFRRACEYADAIARDIYQEEAAKIDSLQREILDIVGKEKPYDIFICYKETDFNGERTEDSIIGQDIYNELTDRGFKVFFARITLEEVFGQKYEPYIFAALNSARIMLVISTNPEYCETVWMKNEWSRFLALCRQDKLKVLLPLYKKMEPEDLPQAFSGYQALRLDSAAFYQDLIRTVEKVTGKSITAAVVSSGGEDTGMLLKRVSIFLEEENWEKADEYCEKVLDLDAENANAYFYKMMGELHIRNEEELDTNQKVLENNKHYMSAVRFANEHFRYRIEGYNTTSIYNFANVLYEQASSAEEYNEVCQWFEKITGYRNADELGTQAKAQANEMIYKQASECFGQNTIEGYRQAEELFSQLGEYKDASQKAEISSHKKDRLLKEKDMFEQYNRDVKKFQESYLSYDDNSAWMEKLEQLYKKKKEHLIEYRDNGLCTLLLAAAMLVLGILYSNGLHELLTKMNLIEGNLGFIIYLCAGTVCSVIWAIACYLLGIYDVSGVDEFVCKSVIVAFLGACVFELFQLYNYPVSFVLYGLAFLIFVKAMFNRRRKNRALDAMQQTEHEIEAGWKTLYSRVWEQYQNICKRYQDIQNQLLKEDEALLVVWNDLTGTKKWFEEHY